MTPKLTITTERIDDFPLLLAVMLQLELPELFDHHLGRHGLHQGLSWGWIATIWLAHILTEGDHRKQPVQNWVKQAKETIEKITGQQVRELDFTDDRLTLLLRRLSKPDIWHEIEKELGQSIIRVYELKPKQVRLDPTTVSGYHEGGKESLFQYGYSKDDPTLKQVKVMVAALDPLGMPLVSQVVAGNVADGRLYVPAVDQVLQIIDGVGLLFVGDSKMSALAIRAHIHHLNQHYLCPLAKTGDTAEEMEKWVEAANNGEKTLEPVYIENEKGERKLLAEGYVFERTLQSEIAPTTNEADPKNGKEQTITWTEQVFVVCSESYRRSSLKGSVRFLSSQYFLGYPIPKMSLDYATRLAMTLKIGSGCLCVAKETLAFYEAQFSQATSGIIDKRQKCTGRGALLEPGVRRSIDLRQLAKAGSPLSHLVSNDPSGFARGPQIFYAHDLTYAA